MPVLRVCADDYLTLFGVELHLLPTNSPAGTVHYGSVGKSLPCLFWWYYRPSSANNLVSKMFDSGMPLITARKRRNPSTLPQGS